MGSTMPSTIMAEPRPVPKPKEKHLAALVAPEGLHRGVVHDFYRALKCGFKVKPHPSASEVMRFRKRSIVDDRSGIADRHRVILPIPGELLDAGDHLFGSQRGPGWKFPRLLLSGSENLHVGSADIDNQHIHDEPFVESFAAREFNITTKITRHEGFG